ncbi:MAG: hypothetical protein JO056_08545 [Alphaproteobacteria bacterium]|nr:hypothetical protein [Alphaproteobacteria bacterium]
MKITAKQLLVQAAACVALVICGFRIFQDIRTGPDSAFAYVGIFAVAGVMIAAASMQRSKQYIVHHPRNVRIAGGVIGLLGVLVMAGIIAVAASGKSQVGTGLDVWIGLGPIFVGFMIYRLPEIATPKKETTDFFEWLKK